MKKKIHLPVHQIVIACSYCNHQYQTLSTSARNLSQNSCSNCHPFYTGNLASEIKVGAVEKYRQRAEKVKTKGKK